jgi:hypothetical protein
VDLFPWGGLVAVIVTPGSPHLRHRSAGFSGSCAQANGEKQATPAIEILPFFLTLMLFYPSLF